MAKKQPRHIAIKGSGKAELDSKTGKLKNRKGKVVNTIAIRRSKKK